MIGFRYSQIEPQLVDALPEIRPAADLFSVTQAPDATGDFIVHNFPAVPGVVYIAGPFDAPDQYQPVTTDSNGVIRSR